MTASPFTITPTPPTTLKLEPGQDGTFSFTVTSLAAPDNVHEVILQALLVDGDDGKGKEVNWLVVGPERTRSIPGGQTVTVTITVRPTASSPRGQHTLKLAIADKDHPNDAFGYSPSVACEVSGPPIQPPPSGLPKWLLPVIIGGGAVLVAVIVVLAVKLAGGKKPAANPPPVADAAVQDASSPADARVVPPVIDAPAPPAGPTPKLHWTFDGDTNNSGSINGFALETPSGVGFVEGKRGRAAAFGPGQFSRVAGIRSVLGTFAQVTIAFWLKEPGNLNFQAFLDCINRNTRPFGGVQIGAGGASISFCVATLSSSLLTGNCNGFTAPTANSFHHWILRYDGRGTGPGQGGPTEIYIDGRLAQTRANEAATNDPVFSTTGMSDVLFVGAPNTAVDDLRIYDQVFTTDEQCTQIIGGTLQGGTCVLP